MKRLGLLFVVFLAITNSTFAQHKLNAKLNGGINSGLPSSEHDLMFMALAFDAGIYYTEDQWSVGIEYNRGLLLFENPKKFAKFELQGSYHLKSNFSARLGVISYQNTLAHQFVTNVHNQGILAGIKVNDLNLYEYRPSQVSVTDVIFESTSVNLGLQYKLDRENNVIFYGDMILTPSVNYIDLTPSATDDPAFDANKAVEGADLKKTFGYRLGVKTIFDQSENFTHNFGTEIGVLAPSPQWYWSISWGLSLNFLER